MFSKYFTDTQVRQVSQLTLTDRLTSRNLTNGSMNPKKSTHIIYGPKAFHPDMVALVAMVCEMILKEMKK